MLIAGRDGEAVNLRPVRWQYPPDAGDWDDRWLVIGCKVDLGERSWSFLDPCLLMADARKLAGWLREAAEGRIEPDPPSADEELLPLLSFMEPALGFSVAARDGGELVIRIYFTAEGAPPWLREDDPHHARHVVELRLWPGQLLAAADDWTRELNALPARPWVDPN